MCGRYATTMDPETLYGLFHAEPDDGDPSSWPAPISGPYGGDIPRPRFNLAPTTQNPVVRLRSVEGEPPTRHIESLRWGLVSSWAKDPSVGNRMINARAESVPDKPAFRKALDRRRCLVPASGYFEWQLRPGPATSKKTTNKQPFYITPADGSVMVFAGLWEYWRSRGADGEPGDPIVSYTILTTESVGELAEIHDRMPLMLTPADWEAWLDLDRRADEVTGLLAPTSQTLLSTLELRPVDRRVGNVANDDRELLARVDPPEELMLL